jgi:hypothetical protein
LRRTGLLQQATDEGNNFILVDCRRAGTFTSARERAWYVFIPPTGQAFEGMTERNDVRIAVMFRSDHAIGRTEKTYRARNAKPACSRDDMLRSTVIGNVNSSFGVTQYLKEPCETIERTISSANARKVEDAIAAITTALCDGKAVLACGNGGSASDAMHCIYHYICERIEAAF